jgi:hypothetical protein
MRNINFKIALSDRFIKIGFEDGELVNIQWDYELVNPGFIRSIKISDKDIAKVLTKHLKQAIRFLRKKRK